MLLAVTSWAHAEITFQMWPKCSQQSCLTYIVWLHSKCNQSVWWKHLRQIDSVPSMFPGCFHWFQGSLPPVGEGLSGIIPDSTIKTPLHARWWWMWNWSPWTYKCLVSIWRTLTLVVGQLTTLSTQKLCRQTVRIHSFSPSLLFSSRWSPFSHTHSFCHISPFLFFHDHPILSRTIR